jgi:phosphocarrier protein
MKCQKVTIVNKLGLHARASAKLVSLASGFAADIVLRRDGQEVNAKSIMGIMMLAAAKGSELELCARGKDAGRALAALGALIRERFGEGE